MGTRFSVQENLVLTLRMSGNCACFFEACFYAIVFPNISFKNITRVPFVAIVLSR